VKIALVKEGFEGSEAGVETTIKEAVMKLKSVGAVVDEVSIPIHSDGEFSPYSTKVPVTSVLNCSAANAIGLPTIAEGAYHQMLQVGMSLQ
jgi:Asp-tRNA(Asn)/Glu-tRNA(Gln) amidotransferase A subunit family amidase